MAAKNEFSFHNNSHMTKIYLKKNTFPKEFSNKMNAFTFLE